MERPAPTPQHGTAGRSRGRSAVIAVYLLGWGTIGLAFTAQNYAVASAKGDPILWREAFAWSFNDWGGWALVAPLAIAGAGRWRLSAETWRRHVPVHLILMVVSVLGHALLVLGAEKAEGIFFDPAMPFGAAYQLYVAKKSALDSLVYWGVVGAVHAASYYRLFRDRELRASQLETRLARSQLQVLRAQLQPHFLFNTLNSISALMHRDVEAADRMVTRLGDLLRLSLTHTERQEVPLRQELDFLNHYLDIQRTRFRDRLTVIVDVAPEAMDALVPSLILQPLVENAIRHGIEPRSTPGRVEVRAQIDGDRLTLEVRDDGPGMPQATGRPSGGHGIGLANTRARLEQLYGEAHRFTLANGGEGGLVVRLEIPHRVGSLPTPVPSHG